VVEDPPADVVRDIVEQRLDQLMQAAEDNGIHDLSQRLDGIGIVEPAALADDTTWQLAQSALNGWVAGMEKPRRSRAAK
jgi:hypothetical protein